MALVPSLSSRWARGPPKSGTLSRALPRVGKASSGVCRLPGVAGVLEAVGLAPRVTGVFARAAQHLTESSWRMPSQRGSSVLNFSFPTRKIFPL